MKLYRIVVLVILAAFLAAACGPAESESQELNLYAWSEYVPQALLDNFTAETGIKVNYDAYSSNEELMAKLQAGASGYDVIIPSDYTVTILTNQGLLEKIDLAQIPNFKNIGDPYKNRDFDPGNQFTVPYQWGTACLVVDTSKVTTPITKWADLWSRGPLEPSRTSTSVQLSSICTEVHLSTRCHGRWGRRPRPP